MRHTRIVTTANASGKDKLERARARREASFAKTRLAAKKKAKPAAPAGYDPDLLYVECGRCGAPVLWEAGKAGELLREAGVNLAEIDASCVLVTDACPVCGSGDTYSVRIFRVSAEPGAEPPARGHA